MIVFKVFIVFCLVIAVTIPFVLLIGLIFFVSKSRQLNGFIWQIDKYGVVQNKNFKSKKLYLSKHLEEKYSRIDFIKYLFDKLQIMKTYFKYAVIIEVVSLIIIFLTIFE
jgi:hypothetical protein